MVRQAENPIPNDEDFYRSLEDTSWFNEHGPTADAFDPQGSSVFRSKYATPDQVFVLRAKALAVCVSCGDRLERPLACVRNRAGLVSPATPETPDAELFFAYVWDVPEEGEAHAEVRLRRKNDGVGGKSTKPGASTRLILFDQLARRFNVLEKPRR